MSRAGGLQAVWWFLRSLHSIESDPTGPSDKIQHYLNTIWAL